MKKFTIIAILTSMLFSTFLKADEVQIVIVKPSVLEEGTQRDLSAAQIAELLPWAKDSKSMLADLLENIQGLGMADKVNRMVDGIQQVVGESAPKNSELFMRYVLNRALVLNDMLDKEMDADGVGAIDVKSRVLVLSIKMAIKYYDVDSAKLSNQKTVSPFSSFGIEYFTFLKELNKSIFDASAQYKIERTSLEWLQWDLYRDLNNASYASSIIKINNALKIFPATKLTDSQSLNYIRQVRKVSEGLNLSIQSSKTDQTNSKKDAYVSKISRGTRVIDKNGRVGIVKDLFSNGLAKVAFDWDGFSTERSISELSEEVENIESLQKSNRVVDKNGRVGIVQYLFANAVVKVVFEWEDFSTSRSFKELSRELESINGLQREDRVIDRSGRVGTVKYLFANAEVKVIFDGDGFSTSRPYNDLAKSI